MPVLKSKRRKRIWYKFPSMIVIGMLYTIYSIIFLIK